MGLGNRSANRHETAAAAKVAARGEDDYDFRPGQRVMTVDGFPGQVTAVNDGPVMGVESYLVTLDNEMGHGEYSPSQLHPVGGTTASTVHTAADDYPELKNILAERPDIAPNTFLASTSTVASNPYGIETFPGQEPNDGADSGVDEHGHLTWGGNSPGCRDTDEYSMFGQNDAAPKTASWDDDDDEKAEADRAAHSDHELDEMRYRGQPGSTNLFDPADLERHIREDHGVEPHENPARHWDQHYWLHHSPDMSVREPFHGWSTFHVHTGSKTAKKHHHNHPLHPNDMYYGRGIYGGWGWPGCAACADGDGPDGDGDGPDGDGDADDAGGSVTAALIPQDQCQHDGEWNLHGQCKQCGYMPETEDDKECDEPYCQENGFPEGWHTRGEHIDPSHMDPGHPDYQDAEKAINDAFAGNEHTWLLDHQSQGPSKYSSKYADTIIDNFQRLRAGERVEVPWDPWAIVTTAAGDPDFRFHVTASWADVRNKAKRIRSEGGVHITAASDGMIHAEVKGDTNVYEAGLQRLPGATAVQSWSCGCKWGAYHWGADDDFSRFAGRMCSHALALQYEAQSRGMFGRTVSADDSAPSWVPRKVVVKYDIDADRNVSAPATAPQSLPRAASLRPVEALSVHAARSGEDYEETALALATVGYQMQPPYGMVDLFDQWRRQSSVNSPWGEPDAPVAPQIPGPTKPRNLNDNPASSGWATTGDPDSWSQQGPSGLDHMTSSLDDSFEPDMPHTADWDGADYGSRPEPAPEPQQHEDKGEGSGVGDALLKAAPTLLRAAPMLLADLHEEPEPALPSTDGSDGDDDLYGAGDIGSTESLEPDDSSFVSTGSIDDIVAQFQATAGAKAINSGSGGQSDGMNLAAAATMYLETGEAPKPGMTTTALKAFTPGEQYQIINEGENVRAANLDRLDIAGTHYEPLEAALAAAENDDEDWMA